MKNHSIFLNNMLITISNWYTVWSIPRKVHIHRQNCRSTKTQ